MELKDSINKAIEFLGEKYFSNLFLEYKEVKESCLLKISRKENKILISYGRRSSLFFALTYIKSHIKSKNYEVSFKRHFENQSIMHDCSRNGSLNIESAKQMILTSALLGNDEFMLYTEDTYEVDSEPLIGYRRGKFTKNEIKDLDEYAKGFGVELVPCIQTLSHLFHVLKWSKYAETKETEQTFDVTNVKTYELIEKMIKSCSEMFSSRKIHIGMDEASDIGSGLYMKGITKDKQELLLNHLNKVIKICEKYGFKPMMWADMFFKLDSHYNGFNFYMNNGPFDKAIVNKIPNIDLVHWDYYNANVKIYNRNFKILNETKKHIIFADGSWRWSGFAPNVSISMLFTKSGLKCAINNKIKDILLTSWGDAGNECSVNTIWATMATHAAFDFFDNPTDKEISMLLKAIAGYSLEEWTMLEKVNFPVESQCISTNPCRFFLYQDVLGGLFDYYAKEEFADFYKKLALKYNKLSKRSSKFAYLFKTMEYLSILLEDKCLVSLHLRNAYKAKNKEKLSDLVSALNIVDNKLSKFENIYYKQWAKENKIFGYEIMDARFGFIHQRIKTARRTITSFLKGNIECIPELEGEIIPYNGIEEIYSVTVFGFSTSSSTNLHY